MKKILRPLTVIALAAALAFSSGCGEDTSWSYKSSGTTLSNGNWIYYTYTEYQNALSKIEEQKSESSSADTSKNGSEQSSEPDLSKEKIENKKALDWIYSEAKDSCIAQLTLEKLVKDKKVKIDEEQLEAMESSYKTYYENYFEKTLTKLGVSEETYIAANARSAYLSQQLFQNIYGKNGSKEVSDDELNKYFKEKYTHYFYISYPLTSTDENGQTTEISDEDKEKAQTNFNKYANMLNKQNKTTDDVVSQYKTDFSSETDPSTSQTVILENSGLSDDLQKAIKELSEKQAVVKTIDNQMYIIYKAPIADYVSKIKTDDKIDATDMTQISRTNILYSMKSDEFEDYLDSEKKKLDYDKNDACMSKYTVQRTIDIIKEAEAESE